MCKWSKWAYGRPWEGRCGRCPGGGRRYGGAAVGPSAVLGVVRAEQRPIGGRSTSGSLLDVWRLCERRGRGAVWTVIGRQEGMVVMGLEAVLR